MRFGSKRTENFSKRTEKFEITRGVAEVYLLFFECNFSTMLTRKEASTPRRIDLRLVYHLCFASLGVEDYLCCELLKHVVAVHYSALDLTRRSVHNCLMCVTRATAY